MAINKAKILKRINDLPEAEREVALQILNEYATAGNSETLDDLKYSDFDEIPVDIMTFIDDDQYLGKGLHIIDEFTGERKCTVFPYWLDMLQKVFPDNLSTRYNTIILTGSIGLGKSFIAVVCQLYLLYRMMCLKDPYAYYGMQPIDKITFSMLNVTLEAASGVGWDKLQQLLQSSDWFMKRGTMSASRTNPEWKPPKGIELVCGSDNRHVVGRALFCNFSDEVNFGIGSDVEKKKRKLKKMISQIDARMVSRFGKGTYLPTLNIIASSKDSDQAFMESYIELKKRNESKTTLIVDEPQWVVRNDKGSPDDPGSFYVAIGNKFLAHELLPVGATEEEADLFRQKGYTLLKVPPIYREAFEDNLDLALTDNAGISTSSSTKYISGVRLNQAKTSEYQNPFMRDIIEVGNAPDDRMQYAQFFDLSRINVNDLKRPLFIHLDMSLTGDKTGIAGVWIMGKRPSTDGSDASRELTYKLAFSVSIKAPKGYQISFEKNRTFIRWLREQGFAIKGISSDTYQSAQIQQNLKADGFNTQILSVDRVDSNSKICIPYQDLKSAIYEQRVQIYQKCDLLTDELIGLERMGDGHIDHTPDGINCFTGDTKIALTDGRVLSFLDLLEEHNLGKQNYVYSMNLDTKKIEAKPIKKVWCSGTATKLVKLTLDNGEVITCTPEHKFMLLSGEYTMAKFLTKNTILMPKNSTIIKVAKIKEVLSCQPVYDMEIPDNHNFALGAGVFVHNSKDQADAFCLHPDTEIYLLSGKHKTIKQLYEERDNLNDWVLGYNIENHKIEPVKIQDVVNNGYKNNLVKLTLDNGQSITCTADHKILTRSGEYLEAKDCLNQSLMPFTYENKLMFKNRDYSYVYNPNEDLSNTGIFVHKLVAEYCHAEEKRKKSDNKNSKEWVVIHHKDCNRFNNNPDNLEYLTNVEHSNKHCSLNSSELKKSQLRNYNKKLWETGTHPLQLIDSERKAQIGHDSLVKLNKSTKHREAVRQNNLKLVANGEHIFQKLPYEVAHNEQSNQKRIETCQERYGGFGFTSAVIQEKCRESCLKNNGYDNPWHSAEKQYEMKLTKLKNAYHKILNYYHLNETDPLTLLDFKIGCYALNLSGITSDPEDIKNAELNIQCDNFNNNEYKKIRTKGNCIKKFIKYSGSDVFTYEEFTNYYTKACTESKEFKNKFRDKPTYEDIVRLGFKLKNHKVVKIEPVPGSEVYDLKLGRIHNFALMSGIFVHNCGALALAGKFADQYSYEYGESLTASLDTTLDDNNDEYKKRNMIEAFQQELVSLYAEIGEPVTFEQHKKSEEYQQYADILDGIIVL